MSTIRHEVDQVWIEGVAGFSPGEYASSAPGCQARRLEAAREHDAAAIGAIGRALAGLS
jgi:hypothetical protein